MAPSILGAAVCEAVAFLVGALTDIPALRQFCLVAATAVLVGFVLQVSWISFSSDFRHEQLFYSFGRVGSFLGTLSALVLCVCLSSGEAVRRRCSTNLI